MTHRVLAALAALAITTSAGAQQIDADTRNRQLAKLQEMRERAAGGGRSGDREGPAHDGFYFRADSGVGYMKMTLPLANEASYAGVGAIAALHLGGSIQERALLGVQVWVASIPSASLSTASGSASPGDVSKPSSSTAIGTLGAGPELTVYFTPSNVYVTSAVGPTWLTVSDSGTSETSKLGVGARITLGAEWMLGRKLGLGLAGVYAFSSNKFTEASVGSVPFQAWHAGLLASFTYN